MTLCHGHPRAWARGALVPTWKCCGMFCLLLHRFTKRLVYDNTYDSFSVARGEILCPRTPSALRGRGREEGQVGNVPNLINCLPLEKHAGVHIWCKFDFGCQHLQSISEKDSSFCQIGLKRESLLICKIKLRNPL